MSDPPPPLLPSPPSVYSKNQRTALSPLKAYLEASKGILSALWVGVCFCVIPAINCEFLPTFLEYLLDFFKATSKLLCGVYVCVCVFLSPLSVDLMNFMTKFQWDKAKYPTSLPLSSLAEIINKVHALFPACKHSTAQRTAVNTSFYPTLAQEAWSIK